MEIKGLIKRKKDILEYVFKPFSEYVKITANDDKITYDVHFRYNGKYELRFNNEFDEVRLRIEEYTVILNTSDFFTITIM